MKNSKLKMEDFLNNELNREQTVNVLGGLGGGTGIVILHEGEPKGTGGTGSGPTNPDPFPVDKN
jgi:hypothetical protein